METGCRWRLLPAAALACLLVAPPAEASGPSSSVRGTVLDASGARVPGALVRLLTATSAEIATTESDGRGEFVLRDLPATPCVLDVERDGFAPHRDVIALVEGVTLDLEVRLEVAAPLETVTVTPLRGEARPTRAVPEFATGTPAATLAGRAYVILPQALAEEAGVHLQQTTPSQGSPYVRGLTGQQVVVLVDGIRFNTATFRPGANQYTALIEPSFVDRIEIVRGPNSTAYGSDSLGGTINVVTAPPVVSAAGGRRLRGAVSFSAASADASAGLSALASAGGPRWSAVGGVDGRRSQDLRTGGGIDSHSVVTRLLGLSSAVLGARLQDTAYTQYGASSRLVARPGSRDTLTLSYLRGVQRGARRYDQLDGGVGNLVAGFDPQTLDFAVARYERVGDGPFESMGVSLSLNRQRDDRSSQSINNAKTGLRSKITLEENETRAVGYHGQAVLAPLGRHRIGFGGEVFDETVRSKRWDHAFDAATNDFTSVTEVRARYPNGSTYRTAAGYARDDVTLVRDRLETVVGARYSAFRFTQSSEGNPQLATGPSVPAYSSAFGDVTFDAGVVANAASWLTLTARVARGFRAPNVNDFASLGLSGLGFEVSSDDAVRLGAETQPIGSSSGPRVGAATLRPEALWSYEGGLKARGARASLTAVAFRSTIDDFIERRTLLLPQGAVGNVVGGQSVIRQDATGAVYTALSSSAVFVRVNGGRVLLVGGEAAGSLKIATSWTLAGTLGYARASDPATGLPPNIENGVPPLTGHLGLRWDPVSRPWWAEIYTHAAAAQRRFSANDLAQARTGGMRARQEILDFFANGALARGLVRDGVLVATGETAEAVALRVLGGDPAAQLPLYRFNPAFATLNVRGGWRLGTHGTLTAILENALDTNYRTMGSGVDGPGVNLVIRHTLAF